MNQRSVVGQLHSKSKQIHGKQDLIVITKRSGGERNWMKVVKRYYKTHTQRNKKPHKHTHIKPHKENTHTHKMVLQTPSKRDAM